MKINGCREESVWISRTEVFANLIKDSHTRECKLY